MSTFVSVGRNICVNLCEKAIRRVHVFTSVSTKKLYFTGQWTSDLHTVEIIFNK